MRSGIKRLERQTVVVSLDTGDTLRGVLVGTYKDCVALAHIHHIEEKADLAGEMTIPRERIAYFQTGVELPPEAA